VVTIGGLLPRELLDRVVAGDKTVPGLDPTDYGLVPGERLNDAITRSWNRLQGVWESFRRALDTLPESDHTATALTRERWLRPLFDELGFAGLPVAKGLAVEGKAYAISHGWGETVPVHLPGARVPIDRVSRGVAGAARTSPHGLVQEFLNRSESCLWGIVSNGLLLRVLRDNASLTRQAYVEFDLQSMFDGEAFSDFVVLWLCCHRSRFEGEPPEKCLLEQWMTEAASAGTRALENLRGGVEKAIQALGEGFVAHRDNAALRDVLRSGGLTAAELQHQVLRLVYRLLFLLVAESRDLLLDPEADATAKERYRSFYSIDRLRTLSGRRRGTAHGDLWQSLVVTMTALGSRGAPALALKPLGSFLWSPDAVEALAGVSLDNRHLLDAVRHLCLVHDEEAKVQRPVDYRNLGAEELGSVYESLLELHAEVDPDGRAFALETAAGNERKTTGSYYTPTSLISVLLDSALDPVLDEAERAGDPEAALLALKVCDPAAGSGHFLIAAAHRIAGRLASVRSGGVEPTPAELRHALRDVIGHCIYGIDVNPMAVELCKVSLWMEATEPGRPLSFLDHRIVCGNSLLGTTPALIDAGVPDEAFKPITGDDKTWATTLKKTNKRERTHRNQGMFAFGSAIAEDVAALAEGVAELDALGDDSVEAIAAKEDRLGKLLHSEPAERAKLAADAWCAAFVTLKVEGAPVITDKVVRMAGETPDKLPSDERQAIEDMADRYRFLHLHVAFPDVFSVPEHLADADNELGGWDGGFDVVLGNPPWDKVEFKEQEFFAVRDPAVASLAGDRRKRAIARLQETDPALHVDFVAALRLTDGQRHLLADSGRFPLCGRGKVNTFSVFAELMRNAVSPTGRVGVIVPTGIATDDTTKLFFADLVDRSSLVSLYDFENRKKVFPGIDSRIKFSLLTLSGDDRPIDEARFVFFALDVADLDDPEKRFTLSPDDFALLNPNTRTCPVFRTRRDAEITKAIYRRVPVLVNEGDSNGNPWGVTFKQGLFNMTSDSHLFRTRDQLESDGWTLEGNQFAKGDDRYLPLYEAKMIHHFDHRWATYDGSDVRDVTRGEKQDPRFVAVPRYWVLESEMESRLDRLETPSLTVWRGIARTTDMRTAIACALPRSPGGGNIDVLLTEARTADATGLLACLTALAFDYVVRQKLSNMHLQFSVMKQLPVLGTDVLAVAGTASLVLELTYTAWDLAGFAADLGYHGPPFRWNEERRALLRAELDALMFRLYGIERDDVDYILDTFPIVRRKDEAAFGEYRTKRLILERFDAMSAAEAAGQTYETVLDPPPADPSCAHPESTRPSWAAPRSTE
jgi:hypothetical protein